MKTNIKLKENSFLNKLEAKISAKSLKIKGKFMSRTGLDDAKLRALQNLPNRLALSLASSSP